MSIEKLASGYNVRWRDSAGRSRKKKVQLWRDAVKLDGEVKRKKAMGELVVHEKGAIRLCDFWAIWVGAYGSVSLTPRTFSTYEQLYSKHISPNIGAVRLKDLDQETITQLMSKLTGSLAPASIRKILTVLQSVLQRAVAWQYVATNAAAGVRKPPLPESRGRAITPEQLAALCKELPDLRSRTVARVLALTGLRPGELRALRWTDLEPDRIVVERAVSSNVAGPTKTRRRRAVMLSTEARRALIEWRLACYDSTGFVFPAARGTGVWTDDGWRLWAKRTFSDAATRAGLKGLRPYDLRHTFVSRLIAEGRDIYWIARQAGHSPTMALETYAHLIESVPSECPAKLDEAETLSPLGDSNP